MERWLPALVGIERSVELVLGGGATCVRSRPETAHEAQLTRDEITASVHYVWFDLAPDQVSALAVGPASLRSVHPAYEHEVELGPATIGELHGDVS